MSSQDNTTTGQYVASDDLQPIPVALPSESEAAEPALRQAPSGFRVFISQSKNIAVVHQVKEILALYDIDYELAVEEETAAIPVPQKILAAMRRCQAGVMVVTAEEQSRMKGNRKKSRELPLREATNPERTTDWMSRSPLVLVLPVLLAAQGSLLEIQVIEGEGAMHLAGSRVSKSLTVRVTDELGKPVKGALVSFRLPEEGPGGVFANGLNTEVILTGEDGVATTPAIRWNRQAGPFHVRVAAVKDQSRAGTAVSQHLSERLAAKGTGPAVSESRRPLPARSKMRSKWVIIALVVAGAAGVGFTTGWAAQRGPQSAATTATPARIERPTISIGKP